MDVHGGKNPLTEQYSAFPGVTQQPKDESGDGKNKLMRAIEGEIRVGHSIIVITDGASPDGHHELPDDTLEEALIELSRESAMGQ